MLPCAWGAIRGARIGHAAHHRSLAASRLRNVFRSYTTERNTADEVRAGTMADFLIRQYRIVSGRLEAEHLKATRKALVVQGIGDVLTAVGTAATWGLSYSRWPTAAWSSRSRGPPRWRCGPPGQRSPRLAA
ncbi:hypothetical protein ABZZ04_31480 [Streptomyces sp. NPDC006435]|uniref:hypothetical protein n=1 Tax=Streptomyces sp. NPDC006435 TaxID=3154300 RepID=UPI0033BC46F8